MRLLEISIQCRVVGVYALHTFTSMRRTVIDVWPVVLSPSGSVIMLESIWHKERRPTEDTVARLEGQRVEVIGTLRREPPLPADGRLNNFYSPCLSPVHALRLVDDTALLAADRLNGGVVRHRNKSGEKVANDDALYAKSNDDDVWSPAPRP